MARHNFKINATVVFLAILVFCCSRDKRTGQKENQAQPKQYSGQASDTLSRYGYFLFNTHKPEQAISKASAFCGGAFFIMINSRIMLVTSRQNFTGLEDSMYMDSGSGPDTVYLSSSDNHHFSLPVDARFIKKVSAHYYRQLKTPFVFYEIDYRAKSFVNIINAFAEYPAKAFSKPDTAFFFGFGNMGVDEILLSPVKEDNSYLNRIEMNSSKLVQDSDTNIYLASCKARGEFVSINAGCPVFFIQHRSLNGKPGAEVRFGGMIAGYDSVTKFVRIVKPSVFYNEVTRLKKALINR